MEADIQVQQMKWPFHKSPLVEIEFGEALYRTKTTRLSHYLEEWIHIYIKCLHDRRLFLRPPRSFLSRHVIRRMEYRILIRFIEVEASKMASIFVTTCSWFCFHVLGSKKRSRCFLVSGRGNWCQLHFHKNLDLPALGPLGELDIGISAESAVRPPIYATKSWVDIFMSTNH